MTESITVRSPEECEAVARGLAEKLEKHGISRAFIALFGEMGVGKTAFSRGFASHFGITAVKSPTYTVLNEYRGRCKIHHFDFYRITDGDDLYSIGYDDVIEDDGYTLGEWSENIVDFLPEDAIRVRISRLYTDENATAEQLMLRRIDVDYGELF
jgi:tRNA threonylcarbamoyladenosine biosynthesis protein TsaE